ncbi:Protein kinase [Venturia nashicola]|uniref:Amino-acid acetyltransferase, mitochondrial n=1 Tax=Venturia nashicola TaxID=86259 RepID=A0A4Z1PEU2_9PEZI|nr:Protein kinase [Venturia nashicola]TLD36371.1 Protein kinase [Venturia nashicola]
MRAAGGLLASLGKPAFPLSSTTIQGSTTATKSTSVTTCSSSRRRRFTSSSSRPGNNRDREKLAEREFFLSVLGTTATKRDAKSYLSRFKRSSSDPQPVSTPKVKEAVSQSAGEEKQSGVNLGNLYASRAIGESPVFAHQPLKTGFFRDSAEESLHVAVVKIRGVKELDDNTLSGVGLTLVQLARLGLQTVLVVDCDQAVVPEGTEDLTQQLKHVMDQCTRVAKAIQEHNKLGARVVDQALVVSSVEEEIPCRVHVRGEVEVQFEDLLLKTMESGCIPIIPPMAYGATGSRERVQPDNVMLALTRQFAGLESPKIPGSNPDATIETTRAAIKSRQNVSVDRVIVLDPIGGIPASKRSDNSHIFINLDQEYDEVRSELLAMGTSTTAPKAVTVAKSTSLLGVSNPFSRLVGSEITPTLGKNDTQSLQADDLSIPTRHTKNLDLIQKCLYLLPPTSSALLTTPYEAASSALLSTVSEQPATNVGTRRKRNPLIHNLLTDKPVVSSSLPVARLTSAEPNSAIELLTPATFFKRGMPLTVIPDPRDNMDGSIGWKSPGPEGTTLRLESDPRIDFQRLLYLIEDSFGRRLDARHYLKRIENKIAGIIIAGEYEGGAILTWEYPPMREGDTVSRPPVPYLDKFAVLRKSQGSGGVADIVFNAMVRTCFPDGVVWRSRSDNPVNKWYFERSVGSWKLPQGSQWCMFWTGKGISNVEGEARETAIEKDKRWQDYVAVCSGIEPSWSDATKPPD